MEPPKPGAGLALSSLAALAFCGIGIAALAAPRRSSGGYGLPARDAASLGYIQALGARDLVLGLMLLRMRHEPRALAASVGLCTLVAVVDFSAVARGDGAHKALLIHACGAACLALSSALLLAGR
jgi:hypothetical protein